MSNHPPTQDGGLPRLATTPHHIQAPRLQFVHSDHTGTTRTVRDAAVNTGTDVTSSPTTSVGTVTSGSTLGNDAEHGSAMASAPPGNPASPQRGSVYSEVSKDAWCGGDPLRERPASRTDNNYESLDRGRPASAQHVYCPVASHGPDHNDGGVRGVASQPTATQNPAQAKGKRDSNPAKGGRDGKQVDVHTCPLPPEVKSGERKDVCMVQVGFSGAPDTRPATHADVSHGDDIIELRADVSKGGEGAEEGGSEGEGEEEKRKEEGGEVKVKRAELNQNVPNTHFAIACMVAMCFNFPLGLAAMYFSLKAVTAFQEGRTKLGQKRSRWSIIISLIGITITTVVVSSVVLYIATQGQKSISRSRAYGSKGGLNL